ncbi:hypothetical protein ACTDI4_19830 [Mesorhizobium sp. PUT5]|uniref:hypothetical protein n=1 Tax=Mesorhizobium sp. PUT5 TaxID=3454629 RepID=UPI003FA44860
MLDGCGELNLAHFPGLPAGGKVSVVPILPGDLAEVALFLHRELNSRLSPEAWQRAIRPCWPVEAPNHGYMLMAGGQVVGVQLAFYADRVIDGRPERFCNVAAWCVAPAYRAHGVRLLTALLAQKDRTFTDLSPSGNVVPLNRRLNFQTLDTASSLIVNWPWPLSGGVRILSDRAQIEARLEGRDLEIFRDHAQAIAAHHLLVTSGSESCYVIFRRERRKRLRLFATLLHVGNPALLRRTLRPLCSHLLTHFGIAATFVEHRVAGFRPAHAIAVAPRARMFRSGDLGAAQIDYLYSELVSVPW